MEAPREEPQRQLLDVEAGQEAPRHSAPWWRWAAASLAVSLCVAAAVLLTWHMQEPDQNEGRSDLQHKLREVAGSDKAAIHLYGEYNGSALLWSSNVGHAFSQGGFELDDNEIVIPHSGLYFVYSQALFRVNCAADERARNAVSHIVQRASDSYDFLWKDLMSSVRSTCGPDSGKHWHDGIYLGAVFDLMEGDRLRTPIEKRLLPSLQWQHGKTFFGAFAL